VQVLQRLREAVQRKRLDKWQRQILLSAPSHTSLVVQQFLAEIYIRVIAQPPNSPDLTLNGFWHFLTLKMGLNGTCFVTMGDFKSNTTAYFRKIPKEAFRWCFNNGRIDGASVCVRKGRTLKVKVSVAAYPTILGTF
jgi:hypothetical protein